MHVSRDTIPLRMKFSFLYIMKKFILWNKCISTLRDFYNRVGEQFVHIKENFFLFKPYVCEEVERLNLEIFKFVVKFYRCLQNFTLFSIN
jgi:hypothetical protein